MRTRKTTHTDTFGAALQQIGLRLSVHQAIRDKNLYDLLSSFKLSIPYQRTPYYMKITLTKFKSFTRVLINAKLRSYSKVCFN